MKKITPRVLRGFRDYLPETMLTKQRMLDTIAKTFESFGFSPLATPAIEYADILLGKYGDEGDKLLYRFKDNGDRDVALRYDLTVPLSRVVAMNGQLNKPFKRYQIAPVWRAEKPGRGRFREFVQCDIDMIGVPSMMADAECLLVGARALESIGVNEFVIRVNNRKLLTALLKRHKIDEGESALGVLRTLDKLPKIGEPATRELLRTQDKLSDDAIDGIFEFLSLDPSALREYFSSDETGVKGAEEIAELLSLAHEMGIADRVEVDLSIARGLDYYTGTIYETFLTNGEGLGAVMSGGRYDRLLEMFGQKDVPSVGISLGIDRLFSFLCETEQVSLEHSPTEVLVTVFDSSLRSHSYSIAEELRTAGLRSEIYPGLVRMKKQFQYAHRCSAQYVVIVGPDEVANQSVKLKTMETGTEIILPRADLTKSILNLKQTDAP